MTVSPDPSALTVRKAPERSRYELLDGEQVVGVADYRERDGVVVLPHTEIAGSRRGQGLGAVLVRAVLDDVRAGGRRAVPACWYVQQFVDEHPDYADVIA